MRASLSFCRGNASILAQAARGARGEQAAGGVGVGAPREAADEADAAPGEGAEKGAALGVVGAPEPAAGVVDVDDRQPQRRSAEQAGQLLRLVLPRVEPRHEDPGEMDAIV